MGSWVVRGSLGVLLLAAPALLGAQGGVSGRVSITERPGERTDDMGNTAVWLVPQAGGAPAVPVTTASIAMQGRKFVPTVRVVGAGSTVEFPNQDPFSHNVFSKRQPGAFDVGSYPRGRTRAQRLTEPGIYPVYCNIHPRMTAWLLVLDTPWMTQAAGDGRFSLAGVPAGRYTLHVWHNRAPEQVRDLVVGPAGLDGLQLALDARGWRYVQHKNKLGQDYVSAGDRY